MSQTLVGMIGATSYFFLINDDQQKGQVNG